MARRMGPLEWLMLVVLSVLWGGSFLFVELAVDTVPPFTLVFGRVAIAAMLLAGWVHLTGGRLPGDPGAWRQFAVMGLINNLVPFALIVWGQTRIDSGLASIINATTPLFVVAVAHVLTADERMTANRLAGVLLGLGGVVVLIGPSALAGVGADVLGQVAVLGAALSYSFAGVYGRRLTRFPPAVASTGMLICSSAMVLPLALMVDGVPTAMPPALAMWSILGIALFSTALGYLLYFRILAAAGATNLLLVTFLIPVTAIGFGVVLLGERLDAGAIAGMALIFAGLACVDGRVFGRNRDGA